MMTLSDAFALGSEGIICFVGAGGKTTTMFRLAHELARNGDAVLTTTTTKIYKPAPDQSPHVIISDSADRILSASESLLRHTRHISAASKTGTDGKLIGFPPDCISELFQAGLFKWILAEGDGASGMPLKAPADHEPVIPATANRVIGIVGMDALHQPIRNPHVFRPEIFMRLTGASAGHCVSEESVAAVLDHEKGIMKGSPEEAVRIVLLNKVNSPERERSARKIAGLLRRKSVGRISRIIIGDVFRESAVTEYFG